MLLGWQATYPVLFPLLYFIVGSNMPILKQNNIIMDLPGISAAKAGHSSKQNKWK